ncbi:MAG: quinol monooxygenase YgiN [Dinoroseobacter sp.]|jgi:quinol monooxygenase YgiN
MPYAVTVTFLIKPDAFDDFMLLIRANSKTSLLDEIDCNQFDVATDPSRPNEVFLYEVYTNRAAFDVHLGSSHFKSFDAATAELIASKDVRTYSQVVQ